MGNNVWYWYENAANGGVLYEKIPIQYKNVNYNNFQSIIENLNNVKLLLDFNHLSLVLKIYCVSLH